MTRPLGWYVEIQSLAMLGDEQFVINKVFNRLHGILRCDDRLVLGLAFPNMSGRTPGNVIRVFGARSDLQVVATNGGLRDLEMRAMIKIAPVAEVPTQAIPIAYKRVRNAERSTPARRLRLARRSRMRQQHGKKSELRQAYEDSEMGESIRPELPYLLIERANQKIPIFVKRDNLLARRPSPNPSFTSYGLGREAGGGIGAVYDF